MRPAAISFVVGVALLPAGTLSGSALAADPPNVTARTSVTIPWYACQFADEWMTVSRKPGTRIDSRWVSSVRKRGYTYPISRGKVCGYMGSGTYTIRMNVKWSRRGWGVKSVPVYRYKDVQKVDHYEYVERAYEDWPFTCTLLKTTTGETGGTPYAFSSYRCALDNGKQWDAGLTLPETYTTTLPEGHQPSWPTWSSYPRENYDDVVVYGNVTTPAPAAFTGTARVATAPEGNRPVYRTVKKRYVHHYRKKKVRRWIPQKSVTEVHVVQVSVR